MNLLQQVTDYIKNEYSEGEVIQMIDEEITSGNWVDEDWDEGGEYASEYEWYQEFGNGEAEDVVSSSIRKEICNKFKITELSFREETKQELFELLESIHPSLN